MALGDGDTWDETVPTNATTAIQIDDYMRHIQKGVRSRMAHEHEWPDSQSATSEAGQHKWMTLQMLTTHPAITGTQVGAVYMKTVDTTGDCFFFVNKATREINLSDRSYFWYIEGAAETGANASATLRLLSAGIAKVARGYCTTTASGGAGLQIDVLYNGNSLWTATASQIILAPGSTSTSVTTFATSAFTAGGLLTIDVDKTGTAVAGGGITIALEVG